MKNLLIIKKSVANADTTHRKFRLFSCISNLTCQLSKTSIPAIVALFFSYSTSAQPLFKPGKYNVGQVVKDTSGVVYRSLKAGTRTAQPKEGTYWTVKPVTFDTVQHITEDATGYVQLETIGCQANNEQWDNGKIINNYLSAFPKGTAIRLHASVGYYHCRTTIYEEDYNFRLVGMGKGATVFRFAAGISGFFCNRVTMYLPHVVLQGFTIQSAAITDNPTQGLRLYTLFNIDDIAVEQFSCKGIEIWGQLQYGHDASGSTTRNISVGGIGGVPDPNHPAAGIFVVGPDANAIFFGGTTDIRDCKGIALMDWTFLGLSIDNLFVHNCLRPFEVRFTTAASKIRGYTEDGMQPALYWGKEIYFTHPLYDMADINKQLN